MTKKKTYVGPCALARKTEAGADNESTIFGSIRVSARANESTGDARLYGRVRLCRVCRAETSNDRLCDTCIEAGIEIRACERCKQTFTAFGPGDVLCLPCLEADARREERAAALEERCRVHRVRHVEDLPVSVLEEMQAEWGRR